MERLTNINVHDVLLSHNSRILLFYYQNIIKRKYNELFLNNNIDYNSDYYKFQLSLYKTLDSIYTNLKIKFSNRNSVIDFKNYQKIFSSTTNEYEKLIYSIYYRHLSNNNYISNDIKKYIIKQNINKNNKKCKSFIIKYNFFYENINVTINFIIYIEKENITVYDILNKYDKYTFHILALLSLVAKLTNNSCSKDGLEIYIFNTPFERKIDNKCNNIRQPLGPKNVNGGFTYGCRQKGSIVIYRDEEFFKVLAHELCHNFGLDEYIFTFINNSLNKNIESELYNKFINNFNLSKKINKEKYDIGIQESLIEFWAIFLNTSLFVFNSNKPYETISYKKIKTYINFFNELFNYEIIHTFFQTQKVLEYNKLSLDLILSNIDYEKLNNYKEATHVFSYIILKLFLLMDYKELINSAITTKKINKLDKYIINFEYSLKNMNKFLEYIVLIKNKNHEYLKSNLKFIENILKKINLNNINNKFIKNNMRLSCIEMM